MVNAVTQERLLWYPFEEGTGTIVFDSSGNGFNALSVGASHNTNHVKWGAYSLKFDGNNDYVQSLGTTDIPLNFSYSGWYYIQSNAGETLFFEIHDTERIHIEFGYNQNTGETFIYYLNNVTLLLEKVTLSLTPITLNAWTNLVISIDTQNQTIKYYKDSVLISTIITPEGILIDQFNNIIKLGNNVANTKDYQGYMDSVMFFDFLLAQSQINDIYNLNGLTLIIDPITPVNETEVIINDFIAYDLIVTTTPLENSQVTQIVEFSADLNHISDCELYINSNLVDSQKGVIAFTYVSNQLELGLNNYQAYCSFVSNNISYYELTPKINFIVEQPVKTIEFFMNDMEGNLLIGIDDLYLVTPCLDSQEMSSYNIPDRELYIKQLVNGYTTFNLSYNADYEFCMLRGKINARDDEFSLNYDFPNVEKQTELGKLYVTDDTYTYSLKVDTPDLYTVVAPEFWGQTWSALFQMIVGMLVGGLLILLGLMAKNDKIIIVGGLVIAIGMGVSITTFVGAII